MKQPKHEFRIGHFIPYRLRLAVFLAFLGHGVFVLTARYRLSYDAYVHMFFGDHYAKDWWSLWEPRWYTGFHVTSYPPLIHQLIGLLGRVIGLDAAFACILWLTLSLYPLAVYSFSRLFVGKTISSYASLGAAFLPSLYLSAHIFGQLPFLSSTLFALFGAVSLAGYLKEGGIHSLSLTVALTTVATASHHAVLLLQPFLIFSVVSKHWLDLKTSELSKAEFRRLDISPRNFQRQSSGGEQNGSKSFAHTLDLLRKILLFTLFAILFGVLVILPFWEWGSVQTMQTPIDHLSRHNFFADPLASALFFLPMYGPLILIIPFSITYHRRLLGLWISFVFLFIIGLGGTTPLPRLVFGAAWEWLTYDRFAFWASLMLLPFFGIMVVRLRHKVPAIRMFGALAITSLIVGSVTLFLPLQPAPVDMKPIVHFLSRDGYSRYRYLTFGFGDQLALLSTLTAATTVDGSYHTARNLPELRSSGIAQIDTAFWFPKGLSSLDPILRRAGERGVRWGFVNRADYIPVLKRNGWTKVETLENGIEVWENPSVVMPEISQPPSTSLLASFIWGTFPLLSLLITILLTKRFIIKAIP